MNDYFTSIERAQEEYGAKLWAIFYDWLTDEIWENAPEGKEQEEVDLFSDYFKGDEHPPTDGFLDIARGWLTMSAEKAYDDMRYEVESACKEWYADWKPLYLETLADKEAAFKGWACIEADD